MTLKQAKEILYNKFGWRLSDREEKVFDFAKKNQEIEMVTWWKLSEREELLIKLAKGEVTL